MEATTIWVNLASKAPEIVMALLFAVFAYALIKQQHEAARENMTRWAEWMEERQEGWKNYLTEIGHANREMWRTHDESFARAMADHDKSTKEMVELICRTMENNNASINPPTRPRPRA